MAWRELLPFALRVELRRLLHLPRVLLDAPRTARERLGPDDAAPFVHLLADGRSPLRRFEGPLDRLQLGKEHNVALAAARLDGLVAWPGQILSYHAAVGRPSRLRGFRPGLELHDGQAGAGVGGGCCQVSNLLYQLGLRGGMKIVERHRHGLDLFPDHGRSVPFGCGATVFYSYRDLKLENPLPQPVLLRMGVQDGELWGELRCEAPVGFRVRVYEVGHRIYRAHDRWIRENRIRRRFTDLTGKLLLDEEVAHNVARLCYEPELVADGLEEAA